MTPRMNIFQAAPDAMKPMLQLEAVLGKSVLEHSLVELVKIRASQINGCAFCIHMHVTDAVKAGESNMRLHLLDAWRESPLFSDRERAALNWTESVTKVAKLETGLEIRVPLFIKEGEKVKVSTESREFAGRA